MADLPSNEYTADQEKAMRSSQQAQNQQNTGIAPALSSVNDAMNKPMGQGAQQSSTTPPKPPGF